MDDIFIGTIFGIPSTYPKQARNLAVYKRPIQSMGNFWWPNCDLLCRPFLFENVREWEKFFKKCLHSQLQLGRQKLPIDCIGLLYTARFLIFWCRLGNKTHEFQQTNYWHFKEGQTLVPLLQRTITAGFFYWVEWKNVHPLKCVLLFSNQLASRLLVARILGYCLSWYRLQICAMLWAFKKFISKGTSLSLLST